MPCTQLCPGRWLSCVSAQMTWKVRRKIKHGTTKLILPINISNGHLKLILLIIINNGHLNSIFYHLYISGGSWSWDPVQCCAWAHPQLWGRAGMVLHWRPGTFCFRHLWLWLWWCKQGWCFTEAISSQFPPKMLEPSLFDLHLAYSGWRDKDKTTCRSWVRLKWVSSVSCSSYCIIRITL